MTMACDQLRQIALAMHTYHGDHGRLPPAVVRDDKDGRPLYSWRVLLLPYLEQNALQGRFKLDEPWDGPHNKPLAETTPKCYLLPLGQDAPGLTRYQVLVGPDTAFERDGLSASDFPDGLANTLLVVEAGQPVPWSKPVDVAYDPLKPLPPLGGIFTKPVYGFLGREVGRARRLHRLLRGLHPSVHPQRHERADPPRPHHAQRRREARCVEAGLMQWCSSNHRSSV